ncbi:CU044_5270 family protein [Streptomyces sp. NPDC048664]|uniref:CU044_5270 family protein n=1 Tax=Streptomyces sp. NPDC048664 TaxID=3154505 RepID=UPI00342FCBAB
MAEDLAALRHANPVPALDPRYQDGPLGHEAERALNRLLHSDRAPTRRHPLARRRTWVLAATAAGAVLALVLPLTGPAGTPAAAAPPPLSIRSGSRPLPLAGLASRVAAGHGSLPLRQGTHVQTWSLGLSDGAGSRPPITLPEERIVRWEADGSHSELVVATDPRKPGKPVLSDADGGPRLVRDGHVLHRQTYGPSWSDAPPQAQPPHSASTLRSYLEEIDTTTSVDDTPALLDAVSQLLDNWTLGSPETTALLRVLAQAKGLRPAGAVTDRLGRPGQAYVYDDAAHAGRGMLILDPATGAVLGLETTATRDDPAFGLRSGDVLTYSAWMR